MTDGPYVVELNAVERSGEWCVEVWVRGQLIRRIDADSEAQAGAMIDDLVKIAQELGGQLN